MKRCLLFLMGLLVLLKVQAIPDHMDKIRVGDSLPQFSMVIQGGDTIHSSALSSSPCAIIFFHTRCYDCRKELPIVQEMYESYGEQIRFICISRAEKEEEISRFWKNEHLTIPYSAQTDKKIFKLFAERVIPRVYISDNKGCIRYMFKEKVRKRKLSNALRQMVQEYETINK